MYIKSNRCLTKYLSFGSYCSSYLFLTTSVFSLCNSQEGVEEGIYSPMEVQVEQKDREGGEIICLTYQMNHFNASLTSPLYKEVGK